MANRKSRIFLSVIVILIALLGITWLTYLRPHLQVKAFVLELNEILDKTPQFNNISAFMDKMNNKIDKLNLDKSEDRAKFKAMVKQMTALIEKNKRLLLKSQAKLVKLTPGEDGKKLKAAVISLNDFDLDTLPKVQAVLEYFDKLFDIMEASGLDELNAGEPTDLEAAKKQISDQGDKAQQLLDSLNKIKVPEEMSEIHSKFVGYVTDVSSFVKEMQTAVSNLDQAGMDAAIAKMDASNANFDNFDIDKAMKPSLSDPDAATHMTYFGKPR